MIALDIELDGVRGSFRPGEIVAGTASWSLFDPPDAVEVILFWEVGPAGPGQLKVVDRRRFERPGATDRRPFRFELLDAPYSGEGRLFAIRWKLELVAYPSHEAIQKEIVVSPSGHYVSLGGRPA